jgi:outer membrane protein assembly factor BamB
MDGTVKWKSDVLDNCKRSIVTLNLNRAYISSNNGFVYSINIFTGETVWKSYDIGSILTDNEKRCITIDNKNNLLIGNGGMYGNIDGKLCYINYIDGTKIWEFAMTSCRCRAMVDSSNTIYCYEYEGTGKLFAINPDGTEKWQYNPGASGQIYSCLALTKDNNILYGQANGIVSCISKDGVKIWEKNVTGTFTEPVTRVIIDKLETVFVATKKGWIYALDSKDGSEKWKYQVSGGEITSLELGPQNDIYCTDFFTSQRCLR